MGKKRGPAPEALRRGPEARVGDATMPQLAPGLLPDTGNPGHPPPDLHFFPSQAAILSEMPQDDGTTVTPSSPSAAVLPEPSRRERTQQTLTWLGVGGACLWLLAQLSPILTPFLAAIILAYIFSPAVDALAPRVRGPGGRRGARRWSGRWRR